MKPAPPWIGIAEFCRMDDRLVRAAASPRGSRILILGALCAVAAGTIPYGFVFGLWRAPLQGLYSAIKMPLLFLSVVAISALATTMIAQIQGILLSLRQLCGVILVGMAVTSAILGALSPIVVFLLIQAPPPNGSEPESMATYWALLLSHVGVVGAAGLAGHIHSYRLLKRLLPTPRQALRLLVSWILVAGFAGCELSWMFSPFLCDPTYAPHILNRGYFEGNFYEHVWHAASVVMERDTR